MFRIHCQYECGVRLFSTTKRMPPDWLAERLVYPDLYKRRQDVLGTWCCFVHVVAQDRHTNINDHCDLKLNVQPHKSSNVNSVQEEKTRSKSSPRHSLRPFDFDAGENWTSSRQVANTTLNNNNNNPHLTSNSELSSSSCPSLDSF